MKDQAEQVTDLVEKEVAFQERMKADADKMATTLMRSYLGPDHKVINMASFHSGLSVSGTLESKAKSIVVAKCSHCFRLEDQEMRTRGRRLRPTPLLHERRSEEQADGNSDCYRTDKDSAAEQVAGRPRNSVHVRGLSVGKVTKP